MWIAVAIVCLVAAFILLLWVPLDLTLWLVVERRVSLRLRLGWFFGLINREIGAVKAKPTEKKKVEAAGRKRPDIGALYEVLKVRGILRQVLRLFRDFFRQIRFKQLSANMRIGLGDPADTGFLFAFIESITPFLGTASTSHFRLQPVFAGDAAWEGYLQGELRLQPARLAVPIGRFVFSRPVLRLGKAFVLRAWKRRR